MVAPDATLTQALLAQYAIEVQSASVVVIEGQDVGARVVLGASPTRIGSGPGTHLRLRDPTVSRLHCELQLLREAVRVVDTGSKNGVLIEGLRVRDADAAVGTTMHVGATALRIEIGDSPIQIALSPRDRLGDLMGASVEMRRLYAVIERVAPTDTTVLIQGETGSGKELVAREIHKASRRANGPFVAVDSGAIVPQLIESELFGHVRGAFSGATVDRKGLFEEANGGTIFLDEIGELPLNLQAKLLRALETREVRRVGANSSRAIDVRVLAATNRSLGQAVNEGTFREELYHRLAVVEMRVPPLRARREDIPLLARYFCGRFSNSDQVPPDLMARLLTRGWPGNVRELRNFIERYVALGGEGNVDLPPSMMPQLEALIPIDLPLKEAREAWMKQFEVGYANAILRKNEGNITHAAEQAGVSRRFLQRLMSRVGIR